jgi:hypothetical protein
MTFKDSAPRAICAGAACLAISSSAGAMEAPSVYPLGIVTFGAAAIPPAGLYDLLSESHVTLNKVMNNAGEPNPIVKKFDTTVDIVSNRLIWVPSGDTLGGRAIYSLIVPVGYTASDRTIGPKSIVGSKLGLGDLTLQAGVGYDLAPQLKTVVGFAVYVPTGAYSKTDPVNIGKNHWAAEPMAAFSYLNKEGLNADIAGGYIFNGRNNATKYTSGHEFHFDYAAGWAFGNGWTAGLGGFVWRQTTDDKNAAGPVLNDRAAANSIGPVVKYDSGKGWVGSIKYEQMTDVKNGPKGNVFWLKVAFPL